MALSHKAQLSAYQAELKAAEEAVQLALKRREFLRQIVGGLQALAAVEEPAEEQTSQRETLFADQATEKAAPVSPPVITPKGREAVRLILEEANGGPLHLDEITRRVVEVHGWMTDVAAPRTALNVAAKRLLKDGVIERVAPAQYRIRRPEPAVRTFVPGEGWRRD